MKSGEKSGHFFLSHFASGNISHCDQIFSKISAPTRQAFLSLVPVSSVVTDLTSALILGVACLLNSGNFTSSCYSSCSIGDSGFPLLLVSGLSCLPPASFLSHLSPVKTIPSVKFPRLVYVLDWTLTDIVINSSLNRLCLR